MSKLVISGTGLYAPGESVSSEELVTAFNQYVQNFNKSNEEAIQAGEVEALQESSAEFIANASGITNRHVLNKEGVLDPDVMMPRVEERPNEEISIQAEMSVNAAKQAMESASVTASDIDAVIGACTTMQRSYPAIAVETQQALGIEGFAFDMNVACSSVTFGIQMACDMIKAGNARSVLIVNPEICTAQINFCDRDSHFIFGDACTALVIQSTDYAKSSDAFEIVDTKLKTMFSNNIRNNFGVINRLTPETRDAPDKLFVQEGRKVFKEVVPWVANTMKEHMAANSIEASSLKRLFLHQANINMNRLISKKVLGRDASAEESPVILNIYGNTASAGSIIAFHLYHDDLPEDSLSMICSFGAGYSVGSVIIKKIKL